MLRVSVVALACWFVLCACVQIAIPLVQLPPLWKMLLTLPGIYAYLLFMIALLQVIPARVDVRRDRVLFNHGESTFVVKAEKIVMTRIVVFAYDRVRLRVVYRRPSGHVRSRVTGVAQKVDLERLSQLLPVAPEIWDARKRYASKIKV